MLYQTVDLQVIIKQTTTAYIYYIYVRLGLCVEEVITVKVIVYFNNLFLIFFIYKPYFNFILIQIFRTLILT